MILQGHFGANLRISDLGCLPTQLKCEDRAKDLNIYTYMDVMRFISNCVLKYFTSSFDMFRILQTVQIVISNTQGC